MGFLFPLVGKVFFWQWTHMIWTEVVKFDSHVLRLLNRLCQPANFPVDYWLPCSYHTVKQGLLQNMYFGRPALIRTCFSLLKWKVFFLHRDVVLLKICLLSLIRNTHTHAEVGGHTVTLFLHNLHRRHRRLCCVILTGKLSIGGGTWCSVPIATVCAADRWQVSMVTIVRMHKE